jgi:predicted RND superfamily exporter protein
VHLVLAITNQADLGAHASQDMMRKVDDFRKRVLAGWEGPKPEVLVTGRTAYVGELSVIMRSDVLTTLFISAALVAVVFWFGFRRVGPLVAILHVLLVSCVIAVGVGAAVFHELNMITIGLCAILIGLGVDFGMMLYSIYDSNALMANHTKPLSPRHYAARGAASSSARSPRRQDFSVMSSAVAPASRNSACSFALASSSRAR